MKITNDLIMAYVTEKQFAPSTQRSEAARLRQLARPLSDGRPETLYKALEKLAPYTRVTSWTRATAFVDWLIGRGDVVAPNAYVRRTPDVSFAEAEARIKTLPAATQNRALQILYSGMRWTESETRQGGQVIGKGGKAREVFVPNVPGPEFQQSYSTFLRQLGTVGLKPHDLRKLALSRLVELGANEYELREIAGWSSLAPALSYIRTDKNKIRSLMKKVAGG
jgi:integrase